MCVFMYLHLNVLKAELYVSLLGHREYLNTQEHILAGVPLWEEKSASK